MRAPIISNRTTGREDEEEIALAAAELYTAPLELRGTAVPFFNESATSDSTCVYPCRGVCYLTVPVDKV